MRFLLTGATGFIGSHLARTLIEHDHDVHALVRPDNDPWRIRDVFSRLQAIELDLASPDLARRVAAARPDVAVHLAWFAEPGRYLDASENLDHLEMSLRLVRALAQAGCPRLLGVGTCFEYATASAPLSEGSPTGPTRLYGATKLALATVLEHARGSTGLSTAWARLFYVYGPAEDERRLVPSVIRSLLSGKTARVSAGDQVRDYLHVTDVATALETIALGAGEGPVNVGSGRPVTVRELVLKAAQAAGRPNQVAFGAVEPDPRDPPYVCADVRRLREGYGFAPRLDLDDGLRQTAAWWAARLTAVGTASDMG